MRVVHPSQCRNRLLLRRMVTAGGECGLTIVQPSNDGFELRPFEREEAGTSYSGEVGVMIKASAITTYLLDDLELLATKANPFAAITNYLRVNGLLADSWEESVLCLI